MLPGNEPERLSPIDPRSLIRHARQRIAPVDADETDYRRAVSDAFYALYHALTLAAVPFMAPSDDPLEPYRRIRRIRHPRVRAVAEAMRGSANDRTREVAHSLLFLYVWREAADYSHLVRFARIHAEEIIEIADEAVGAVAEAGFGDAFPRQLAALPDAP